MGSSRVLGEAEEVQLPGVFPGRTRMDPRGKEVRMGATGQVPGQKAGQLTGQIAGERARGIRMSGCSPALSERIRCFF